MKTTDNLNYTQFKILLGDAKKAKKELNWKPETNIRSLVKEMVIEELKRIN